jgi:hypothetical protein
VAGLDETNSGTASGKPISPTPKTDIVFYEEKMWSVAARRQTAAFLKFQMAALCRDAPRCP